MDGEHWSGFELLAHERWEQRVHAGTMSPSSARRYTRVLSSFARFAAAHGVEHPENVTPGLCSRFFRAPLRQQQDPSDSTSRFRLTVTRQAFDLLVDVTDSVNPTRDLKVEMGSAVNAPSPLTPIEASRLRKACRLRPSDTVRPVAVELALRGLTHTEIAGCVFSDFSPGFVYVEAGTSESTRRSVLIAEPDRQIFVARERAQRRTWRRRDLGWDSTKVPVALARPLASYPAESISPSISSNLSRAMHAAGITRSAVRPRSLREYAANRHYALTSRIEDVADQLGLASYDVASQLICPEWQDAWGRTIRDAER